MTPDQIALVRESFARIAPQRETVAARFYEKLFDIDPSVRPLFRGDLRAQGTKLMAALGAVVASLDDLGPVLDGVRDLARRHVRYGVEERHYASVGQALMATLQEGFGPAFTPALREAWAIAYGALSGAMIDATRRTLEDAA